MSPAQRLSLAAPRLPPSSAHLSLAPSPVHVPRDVYPHPQSTLSIDPSPCWTILADHGAREASFLSRAARMASGTKQVLDKYPDHVEGGRGRGRQGTGRTPLPVGTERPLEATSRTSRI